MVVVILGILAKIGLNTYTTTTNQATAKAAQNNLISIYNAQNNYTLDHGTYCYQGAAGSVTCDPLGTLGCSRTLAGINCNMSMTLTDSYFTYQCFRLLTNDFTCTATNIQDAAFTLTIVSSPPTIILPGGTGCVSAVNGYPAPCNPSCNYPAHPNYCPNS
jgi:type II secretory pathway pseudopilin PulG